MTELKRWIAKTRKRWGKHNGVIPAFAFDSIRYFKLERGHKKKLRREPLLR